PGTRIYSISLADRLRDLCSHGGILSAPGCIAPILDPIDRCRLLYCPGRRLVAFLPSPAVALGPAGPCSWTSAIPRPSAPAGRRRWRCREAPSGPPRGWCLGFGLVGTSADRKCPRPS